MEGVTIIESKELNHLKLRLENIEQNQLAILKHLQSLTPLAYQNNVTGYISIEDACRKYKTSHTTINYKMKKYKLSKGREIDRLQSGAFKLVNETELQEALRIKGEVPKFV